MAKSLAEDVFVYMADPTHMGEWQASVVSVRPGDDAPAHVGSRTVVTRRVKRREMTMTTQIDEMTPPRSLRAHGIDGPVRLTVTTTIDPLDNGARSRVTISLDFESHGMG